MIWLERMSSRQSLASTISHDSYLGCDHDIENDRIRGDKEYSIENEKGAFRIIAIGNSYTFGCEVGDNETYPFFIEELINNSEVLNMAVPGYGIDQAVIKYLKYGEKYRPHLILFGIYSGNYERASVSFFIYSKPVFKYNDGTEKIELTNTNIPPPIELYSYLSQKEGKFPTLYSFPFLKKAAMYIYHEYLGGSRKKQYYQDMNMIVDHIFKNLMQSIEHVGAKLLVIEIPNGDNFRNEKSLLHGKVEKMYLRKVYHKYDIPYIDLQEVMLSKYSMDEIFSEFFTHLSDGSGGHFNRRGNFEVARIISDKIKNSHARMGILK